MINYKLNKLAKYYYNYLTNKIPYRNNFDIPLMLLNKANTDCYNAKEKLIYNDLINRLTYDCYNATLEVTVDNSNKEVWEMNNPNCVNRKTWEKIAYKICNKYQLNIDIEKTDLICNVAFDIIRNTISCDILTSISVQQKMCEHNIEIQRNEEECAIDYKLLIEKYPDCNLTRKDFFYLVNNKYSYELISMVYDTNLKFEVYGNGEIKLISPTYTYSLPDDLRFKEIVVNKTSNSLVLLDKQLKEYKLNNTIKNLLLNGKYYV